jgi:polysaccharide export outer membrane protein
LTVFPQTFGPFVFSLALLVVGCVSTTVTREPEEGQPALPAQSNADSSPPAPVMTGSGDLEKLARLWEERSADNAVADYPVGPGDVVEISVPAMEELKARVVRVAGDGTISLPFVGRIGVSGLTEDELRETIAARLEKYMHSPRVTSFVREYRSRQVAVLGAVAKPGLYSLNTGADTILDMISQAGGILPGADPRIYLIPAEPADSGQVQKIAATLPQTLLSHDPAPLILKRTEPILIDIKEMAFGGYQHYLSLSVRPGDVLMVPGGGQVLVEGWVAKPGAYGVSPGLTVSGVVVAAGGPLYPADTAAVKVIRTDKGGQKRFLTADLEKIKKGESPDISVQGGDIIEVTATTSRLVPYGLYRFFSTVISVGVGGTVPLF